MKIKKGLLNLVTCYNNEFSSLASHACRTISNEKIFVNAVEFKFSSQGFRSDSWYQFVRNKVELLKKLFDASPEGEVVGMFDCDIQFFCPQKIVDLWEEMKLSNFYYVGLTEGCCGNLGDKLLYEPSGEDTNTGFVLLKKCDDTRKLLDEVLSRNFKEKHLGDQTVINECLRSLGTRKALMNPCIFVHGCCGSRMDLAMQHATCCYNFNQKMTQMDRFRSELGLSSVNWGDPSFGNSCERFQSE